MAERPRLAHGGVVAQVETLLRERVRTGEWAVGTKLPGEAALATELGVGRSSVREAVRLLARDGLLDVRHGAGTFVTAADPNAADVAALLRRARLIEVYEVRRALEVEAARLAAHRALPAEVSALRTRLVERAAHATDPEQFVAIDLDFHEAVVALSGNPILLHLFQVARSVMQAALVDRISADGHLPDTGPAHDALLDALEAGDARAAVAATEANLGSVLDEA